jgi:hypothetical protein
MYCKRVIKRAYMFSFSLKLRIRSKELYEDVSYDLLLRLSH